MLQKHLQGLIAAPFTPMHPDGSLNLAVVPSYYAMLRNNGVAGAFICGSTGEGVSLTITEKMAVAEAWASCTKNDSGFTTIPLLGGSCIADAQALAKHAEAIGLDAVAFTSPCYFKPANVDMLAACCSEVASVVPNMPFYYYHIPVLTGVGFAMYDLLKAIDGKIPNFAGIKYTHEDFMDFLTCLHFKNRQYDMVWGRDENMLPALAIGTKASIGSTYNYAAPLYHALIEAFNKADLPKAQMLQQKSIDMIRLLGKYGGIATGKAYMKMIDLDCGTFRLPVTNMDSANFELFKNEVASIGFADFCSK